MADDVLPPPWKQGPLGRAWRCDHAALRNKLGVAAGLDATLGSWIVWAPWAHPIWHSYWLCLVHLRPLPDGRATKFYRPDATHEFWLYALDPGKPRAPAVLGQDRPALLTPANFAAQLVEASDANAIARIEATTDLILAGELNPDTDARRQWEALFGSAMVKSEWRR